MKSSIILLLLLWSFTMQAQWVPFVHNVDKASQMQGTQTWCISIYDNEWVFFANQKSMVQYDGVSWQHFELNNESDVRSVYASRELKKIFVGGIHEFGYFSPNSDGKLHYTCLSDSMSEYDRSIGNIWNICETTTGIYFQGDNGIIRWYDNKVSVINTLGKKLICMAVLNDVPYIGTDNGIWMIVGNTLFPMQNGESVSTTYIRCLTPFRDGLLVGTMRSGLLFANKKGIEPFETPIDEYIKSNELFCFDVLGDKIAIGTIQNGIVVIDTQTEKITTINEKNGLKDNTVLSIAFDDIGNVWAGLDHGLAYAYLNLPFSDLQTNGLSLGTGYAAAVKNDKIYLGTNRGLYVGDYDASEHYLISNLHLVKKTGGQVWSLQEVDGDLFCMHDKGLMLVDGETCHEIDGLLGAWCCQPIAGHEGMMYVGTYQGLYVAQKTDGQWRISHKVEGISDSYAAIEQETARIVWCFDGGSIICLTLDSKFQFIEKRTIYGEADGLPGKVLSICMINNRICACTANGLYKYNHHSMRFERSEAFEEQLANHAGYRKINRYGKKLLAIKNGRISINNASEGWNSTMTWSINQLIVEMPTNFLNIYPLSDSVYIFPTISGFSLLETSIKSQTKTLHNHSFGIRQMTLTNETDSVIYTANYAQQKPTIRLDYDNNTVRFDYDADMLCQNIVKFRYRLTGSEWSALSNTKSKEYSDLHEGLYTFEVEAFSGTEIYACDSISFEILPPWYRTIWAKLIYMLIFVMVLSMIFLLDRKRMARSNRRLMADMDERMEAQEKAFEEERERQEQHIMQLEKERLEFNLKHKSQEMANLMINIARKNEMLIDVKEEIGRVVAAIKAGETRYGSQQLIALNSRIDSNMANDDLLKRVEEQFDIIHDNFIKKISEQYPELTNNERMMCAYIKMGLSTKEMAPLLNISQRGVETMRYRLRKKLGLDREDGLTAFVNGYN